jgi:hypothetical protein
MAYRLLLAVETFGSAFFDRGEHTELEIREVVGFLVQVCDRHGLRFVADGGVLMQPASMNNVMSARSWLIFNPAMKVEWPKETDDGEVQGHGDVPDGTDARDSEPADGVRGGEESQRDRR